MPYYRVRGEVIEVYEDYIEADNEAEALEKAQDMNCTIYNNDEYCEEISKDEYEENIIP